MTKQAKYNPKILPVILCGGSGTRLWPLSRKSLPKQFVPLLGSKSLLQATLERVSEIAGDQPIWIVASEGHRFLVRDAAEAAKVSCMSILESVGRNTAAAMAAVALNAKSSQLLLFLPADHYVPDTKRFVQTVYQAVNAAEQGAFVTFGVTPTHPHTGYGYMQTRLPYSAHNDVLPVIRFVEKPNQEIALSCFSSGNYYWNAGILLVRAEALIEALSNYASDILESTRQAVNTQKIDGDFIHLGVEAFEACRAESIDYAVLEQHTSVVMVPFQGAWSDIGNWNAIAELSEADDQNNRIVGNGKTHNASSTYIHALHRPVVALGTEDLLIIDTADAVLVAAKSHAEQVKDIVENLQKQNLPQANEHKYATRPWGKYDSIDEGDRFKVKRITVKPGASLSLQLHHHRAEHWIVVRGTARVIRDNETFLLAENESTFIPVGIKHRLENPGMIPLEIIEVQSGGYLGEDDIERFDDHYGRASSFELE